MSGSTRHAVRRDRRRAEPRFRVVAAWTLAGALAALMCGPLRGEPPRDEPRPSSGPRAALNAMMSRSGIRAPGDRPLVIDADIAIPTRDGAGRTGKARWIWGGDDRWRSEIVFPGDAYFVEGQDADVRWDLRSMPFVPLSILMVDETWAGRARATVPEVEVRPRLVKRREGGTEVYCAQYRRGESLEWSELCAEAGTGVLVSQRLRDGLVAARVRFDPPTEQSGGELPGGFTIHVDGREVARVTSVTRGAFDPGLAGVFEPPPGARTGPRCNALTDPRLIPDTWVAPVYPPRWRESRRGGQVLLAARIEADGSIVQIAVLDLRGGSEFGESAATAIRSWRYEPALCDGQPLSTDFWIHVAYGLQ